MAECWIQTYSGKRLDLLDPKEEQIDLSDIAIGLAKRARFSGHTRGVYTVGEHSTLMALYAREKRNEYAAIMALLHDAPEAVLPDVQTDLKGHLPGFRDIEDRMLDKMMSALLTPEQKELALAEKAWVKELDRRMLITEKKQLFYHDMQWAIDREGIEPIPGMQFICPDYKVVAIIFAQTAREIGISFNAKERDDSVNSANDWLAKIMQPEVEEENEA